MASSLGRALGCSVRHEIKSSINPLIYTIVLEFSQPQDGLTLMRVWNLIQLYASKNDTIFQGRPIMEPTSIKVQVGVKTKRGPAREDVPW